MRGPLHELPVPSPRRRITWLPALVLAIVAATSLLAPLLAPHDPYSTFEGQAIMPPSRQHLLGTDSLGRDVLSRTLWGGRQTLLTALMATAIAVIPGLCMGIVAGFAGGWVDRLILALLDVLLAFPGLLLAMAIIAATGTGQLQIAAAVGITGLPAYARMIRAAVREIRNAPFVEAARAVGASHLRILVYHLLPNIRPIALSFAGVSLSWAVLNGAALAFLGLGGDPATPDWGIMLNEGRAVFRIAPWVALPPGLAITVTIFAVNRLADTFEEKARSPR
ncbi:MAG: ABC transporter permease subunit [Anaerolineae bacterium]